MLHLAAGEAAAMATAAAVSKVLLIHQAPGEDRQAHLDAVQAEFSGQVALAEVGKSYAAGVVG